MTEKKGGISVDTEHIFPVIKKWLYSEKEIFLREIVSNACDAITKLRRLISLGDDIARDIRNNPQFDSEHFEYQLIQKRIRQNEEQKNIYKEYIRDIKEAIEYKLETRIKLVEKLKKKKQGNE